MPAVNAWAALQHLKPSGETSWFIVLVVVVIGIISLAIIIYKENKADNEFYEQLHGRDARRD